MANVLSGRESIMNVKQLGLSGLHARAAGVPREAFFENTGIGLRSSSMIVSLPAEGWMHDLVGASAWLNSLPLTTAGLLGKVVLVDFWTYTCINWLRTLPYMRAWTKKYKAHGLLVIGVHTPEFAFEHDIENVRRAVQEMHIEYPVAIDNDYAIWDAFDNHYWPALYVVDAQGQIRHHHFGEGAYQRSEPVVQRLLADAGVVGIGHDLAAVDAHGAEVAADLGSLQSAETYLGYGRGEHFASSSGAIPDRRNIYTLPTQLQLNQWGLSGEWTVGEQAARLHQAGGRIVFRFHARDLNLVMGPAWRSAPMRMHVRIDGLAPGAAHGIDVDEHGNGTVSEQRLYQLIRQSQPIADRTFEVEFLDPGVEVFVFTFG